MTIIYIKIKVYIFYVHMLQYAVMDSVLLPSCSLDKLSETPHNLSNLP